MQPAEVLHESSVQTLPSSQIGAGPPRHAPLAQVSFVVQAFPSLHGAVLFAWAQPVTVSHVSSVQELPSSHARGAPPMQAPAPLHVSPVVQASPSLHAAPGSGTKTQPLDASQPSEVHGLLSLHSSCCPPTQTPFVSQWSFMVQALASSQELAGFGVL